MPLFQENPLRSAVVATAAVAVGHFITRFLVSAGASQLLQTTVAIIAIAGLVGLIVMHHRQEGQLLTQDQEEYILIGGLALTWVVIVIAWRSLSGGGDSGLGGYGSSRPSSLGGGWRASRGDCGPGDAYCHVVEEYYY